MIKQLAVASLIGSLSSFTAHAEKATATASEESLVQETRSIEQRLTDLERKVDQILKAVTVSQRTGVGKYVKQELPNIQKSLRGLEHDLNRVSDNVRSIRSGR